MSQILAVTLVWIWFLFIFVLQIIKKLYLLISYNTLCTHTHIYTYLYTHKGVSGSFSDPACFVQLPSRVVMLPHKMLSIVQV